jgi:hypothetical protein
MAGTLADAGGEFASPSEAGAIEVVDTGAPADSIGMAEISEDGTLVLTLRAAGNGAVGDARIVYTKSDPRYDEVKKHVGPLKPGEQKPVRPFP